MMSLRGDFFLPSSLLGAREWGDESMRGSLSGVGGGSLGGASQTDNHQSPGGFVKAWIIPQELLTPLVRGAASECAWLTCPQVMLPLLVRGSHFENQWSSGMGQGRVRWISPLGPLTVGTVFDKSCVRPEVTFPCPHLIASSSACALYIFMCKRIRWVSPSLLYRKESVLAGDLICPSVP